MALDFLAPFDKVETLGFFPGGIKLHAIKKLFDAFDFKYFLIFLHLFEVLDRSNIRKDAHLCDI